MNVKDIIDKEVKYFLSTAEDHGLCAWREGEYLGKMKIEVDEKGDPISIMPPNPEWDSWVKYTKNNMKNGCFIYHHDYYMVISGVTEW